VKPSLANASAYCIVSIFNAAFEILYAGVGNENLPVRAIEPMVDELGKSKPSAFSTKDEEYDLEAPREIYL